LANLTILERPRVTALCTVADVKLDLGITSNAFDEQIADYIDEATSDIEAFCHRRFARGAFAERLPGDGSLSVMVDRTPVVELNGVTMCGETFADVEVYNAEAGILYHGNRFTDTRPIRRWIEAHIDNDLAAQRITASYVGGYLMPGDDVLASGTLEAIAATRTFRLGAPNRWPILVSGDTFRTSGFAEAANNGQFSVQAIEDGDVIVAEDIVDEAAGAVVNVRVRTVPAVLSMCARQTVRDRYFARGRDGEVVSEKIGDWSATYRGGAGSAASTGDASDGGFTPSVARKLSAWVRIV
jgi:hypothetical protein